ncbi:hypothetical protein WN51_01800 [Melipona quadrifasciata]|uniref:Histone-lysine N-methyltransferase SETMAR n=1 Tax=Melipona quadrifasciata TaxID=166423 RepID=A0A0M8ZXY6_9HYME|nr:hypothetical protein WN51_01800 [Melipona quadrifasciata]
MVQALLPQATQQRLQYAIRFQHLVKDDNNLILNTLIMSDEAHFHLNGYINTLSPASILLRLPFSPQRPSAWAIFETAEINREI